MIPKVIHFCWYGKGDYNATLKKCMASWEKVLPDYRIVKWDETNTPFETLPFLKVLYKQKRWAFLSDYMRLYAVYKYGGVYLDTDVEVLKDFGSLLTQKSFIGFQTDVEQSKHLFNSAVIGGEKGNEFIKKSLQETEKIQRMSFHPMGGPVVSTKVLVNDYGVEKHQNYYLNDVTVLTKDYFYPFSWLETFTEDCVTANTVAIHWWEDSWALGNRTLRDWWRSLNRKIERFPLIVKSKFVYYLQGSEKFYLFDKGK